MKTIEELATDCANHYLGRIEGHTDHFETLRKFSSKAMSKPEETMLLAMPMVNFME